MRGEAGEGGEGGTHPLVKVSVSSSASKADGAIGGRCPRLRPLPPASITLFQAYTLTPSKLNMTVGRAALKTVAIFSS